LSLTAAGPAPAVFCFSALANLLLRVPAVVARS
jgi:hypothetical protein